MVVIASLIRIRVRLELMGHISAVCATCCSVAVHHRTSPYIQNTTFSVTLDTFTHCNTLQHIARCDTANTLQCTATRRTQCTYVALDTSTHFHQRHHTATRCNTLQHAATLPHIPRHCTQCKTRRHQEVQCVAVCCSVLRCVVVYCSVLQCVAVGVDIKSCTA